MKRSFLSALARLGVATLCGLGAHPASAQPAQPDMSKYILTPKPAATPRINGARIFGVRPGSEFLYTIPATGLRPMAFAAMVPSDLTVTALELLLHFTVA